MRSDHRPDDVVRILDRRHPVAHGLVDGITQCAGSAANRADLRAGLEEALECCRRLAPEHLSLQGATFERNADRFEMGAALFIGSASAEVLGDYGAGPNHVLPTGGAAGAHSALSVATFMRFQTRLQIADARAAADLLRDATSLGRLEGLEAHARSAELRHPQ